MLAKFVAYASVTWFFASIVIAAGRNDAIAQAFRPIKSVRAFIWQLILAAWVVMLFVLQLIGCPDILGQRPIVWATLGMAIYAWVCLGNYYFSGGER